MEPDKLRDQLMTAHRLLGAVGLHSRWRLFAGTLAEWTLDYPANDPSFTLDDPMLPLFRGGLLRVDESNAEAFCEAMAPYEVFTDTLRQWMGEEGIGNFPILMLVDFDRRLFVHGYGEPVEPRSGYIPAGWTGIEGTPLEYLPQELQAVWS